MPITQYAVSFSYLVFLQCIEITRWKAIKENEVLFVIKISNLWLAASLILLLYQYCSENFCLGCDQLLRSQENNILQQWQMCYLIPFPCWHSNQILSLEGTETSYPGGCRWVPVCSCSWDRKSDLRIRLCDSRAEPATVWMVWQHFVWTGSSRWRGKAARATMYIRKLYDRSDMSDVWFCVLWIPAEFFWHSKCLV